MKNNSGLNAYLDWIRLGRIRLCEEIKGPIYEQLHLKKMFLEQIIVNYLE